MKISIIVPVYNAEKYLSRCLESIIRSLLAAEASGVTGEIIAVDNGSGDRSREIIEEFTRQLKTMPVLQGNTGRGTPARKALALRIVECQTPGASAARNCGVREARGEYIWFIDADDEITSDAVSKLVACADEANADLVMMGARRVYSDGRDDYLSAVCPEEPDYKSRFVRYGAGPWQFLIRREWWTENGFWFREGIIQEDMEMMSALILYTERFAAVDEPLYLYHQNANSVLHRRSWSEHAYDIFPALTGLYERFQAIGAEKQYHDELEWFFIWNLLIDSAKDFAAFPEGRPGFRRSREMLSRYFPGWRRNRFLRQKSLKLRVRVLINYYRNR